MAWFLPDRLGTPRDLADNTGAILNPIDYHAYGEVIGEIELSQGDRWRFTDRELDAETGLQYHRHRYDLAPAGVWASESSRGRLTATAGGGVMITGQAVAGMGVVMGGTVVAGTSGRIVWMPVVEELQEHLPRTLPSIL